MDFAKHTSEGQEIKRLEEVIALRDKEIHDIKYSLADILEEIRNLNEQNDYGQPEVKKRKISDTGCERFYFIYHRSKWICLNYRGNELKKYRNVWYTEQDHTSLSEKYGDI